MGQGCEMSLIHIQAAPIDIVISGHPPHGGLRGSETAASALHDPFQNAHVVAKSRPQKLSLLVSSEPIDKEDTRFVREGAAHANPMLEVVAHVVATEGQHGEEVPPHDSF